MSKKSEFIGVHVSQEEKEKLQLIRQRLIEKTKLPINTAETMRYLINQASELQEERA